MPGTFPKQRTDDLTGRAFHIPLPSMRLFVPSAVSTICRPSSNIIMPYTSKPSSTADHTALVHAAEDRQGVSVDVCPVACAAKANHYLWRQRPRFEMDTTLKAQPELDEREVELEEPEPLGDELRDVLGLLRPRAGRLAGGDDGRARTTGERERRRGGGERRSGRRGDGDRRRTGDGGRRRGLGNLRRGGDMYLGLGGGLRRRIGGDKRRPGER